MKFRNLILSTVLGIMVSAFAAYAAVTLNNIDGTGFIGRGDVITYVGKSGLVTTPTIQFTDVVRLEQDCVKEANGGTNGVRVIQHNFVRARQINSVLQYESRQAKGNGNITGCLLTGYSGATTTPLPPSLCPADEAGWAPAGPVEVTSSTGGALTFQGVIIPY
jgi:hypothetical protein